MGRALWADEKRVVAQFQAAVLELIGGADDDDEEEEESDLYDDAAESDEAEEDEGALSAMTPRRGERLGIALQQSQRSTAG